MYDLKYETKQNNSKKRIRASQACVHCRKKKIKCDENRPSCTQCRETNTVCEYSEPKKRGPRKGYVQLLEERLAQMERKLMGTQTSSPNQQVTMDEASAGSPSMSPSNRSPIRLYENPDIISDLPPIDIVNHLVDLFFKYINSVFPIVHRQALKKSIQDGSVSRPLLYSVLAISARFSEHPAIRTDPPYLAGEGFAKKALSLVNADTLEPSLENIQFWGIMSCLEYGRASGSKSWIYGSLATRFCQELGNYREEAMSVPIFSEDGSVDAVAMAVRRRIFWSCFCIDRLSSAGTHRPHCIDKSDCDVNYPPISECLLLRDPMFHRNTNGKPVSDDSLVDIPRYYMKSVEIYGEVNKFMNRAKSNTADIVWPPIAEFRNLDSQLRAWRESLPVTFQFNQKNLQLHREHSNYNYLTSWLSSHAIWCSSMMVLHRVSLAYSDVNLTDNIGKDVYRRIQSSIETCRMCVRDAMGIFEAIKDYCGYNVLPYIGYSAYVFATILMTSTFSETPELCRKSNRALKILYKLIDGLRPYWPMCERLANATQELLATHQKLYEQDIASTAYDAYTFEARPTAQNIRQSYNNESSSINSRSPSSTMTKSPTMIDNTSQRIDASPSLSILLGTTTATNDPVIVPSYQQPQMSDPYKSSLPSTNNSQYMVPPSSARSSNNSLHYANQHRSQQQTDQSPGLAGNWNKGNEINFNSLEFLYDTGLFGQVVFDANSNGTASSQALGYPPQQPLYQTLPPFMAPTSSSPSSSSASNTSTPTTTPSTHTSAFSSTVLNNNQQRSPPSMNQPSSSPASMSAFQPIITQQQQQQQQNSPATYNPSKSLWS